MASCSCCRGLGALRHAEALADVSGGAPRRAAQRDLLEEQRQDERDQRHRHRSEEHDVHRVRVGRRRSARSGRRDRRAAPSGVADRGGVDAGRRGHGCGQPVVEHVGVDGAEHGGAERAAQGAEERHPRGRDAEVGVPAGALHDDRQDLHGRADADAEHQHPQRHLPVRRVARRAGTAGTGPTAITAEPTTGKIL